MTTKLLALLCLALVLGACESNSNETQPSASPAAQVSPTPAEHAPPEAVPTASAAFKAGDKVKVKISGTATEATIVSIDEKAGTASVKVQGETKERTVNLSEIVKQ